MRDRLEQLRDDPAGLEALYRKAMKDGDEAAFREALTECAGGAPESVLLRAWAVRLDREASAGAAAEADRRDGNRARHWQTALAASVACGALFALLGWGKPPAPVPGVAQPLFWIGWAPLAAVAVVAFVALAGPRRGRLRGYGIVAAVAVVAGTLSTILMWGRTDDAAVLVAMHLPLVAWGLVGAAVTAGHGDRARQIYAYAVQSMETLITGAIFVAMGVIFAGLTAGIFEVMGVQFSDPLIFAAAAFGIGAVPVLALASVYDPATAPAAQRPSGIARILRIVVLLLLPVALGVLALYVLWFIPIHFWRPFQEREVLIVYNATIVAVLALLAAATSGVADSDQGPSPSLLRGAVVSLTGLTMLLNVYALAANLTRVVELGWTPNRHAVLGWNLVTLAMLAYLLARSVSVESSAWPEEFRTSLGRAIPLAVAWACWVTWVIPLI